MPQKPKFYQCSKCGHQFGWALPESEPHCPNCKGAAKPIEESDIPPASDQSNQYDL